MMIEERTICLGERRRVALDTWLINGAPFDIANPKYEVSVAGSVVASGVPTACPRGTHWFLECYVEPKTPYPHMLTISYDLGEEHIIRKLKLNVRR